jgi:hypothetical protein
MEKESKARKSQSKPFVEYQNEIFVLVEVLIMAKNR